jgi:2-dehydro-3-deoxyglucarate aldolase/4-hydroxy-2-oxoheptanedioate aldolase
MKNLKEELRQGRSILGTMITMFRNPDLTKMLQVCGFDFFIVDCEHGAFDYSDVAGLFMMAREVGIAPMIRIPEARREVILRSMEMGAMGILLPQTETVEQAKTLVECAKYAPLGSRGVSLLRSHTRFEKIANAREYMDNANDTTILMAQIESAKGVKNLEGILDVEGIDAAFVGPNDLTQSLGIMGQKEHPKYLEAIDTIITTAKQKNKFSGIHLMSVPELLPYIEKGMTCNLWSSDVTMLMSSGREGVSQLKR